MMQKSACLSQFSVVQKSVDIPGEGGDQLVHEVLGGLGEHCLVRLLVLPLGGWGDLNIRHRHTRY